MYSRLFITCYILYIMQSPLLSSPSPRSLLTGLSIKSRPSGEIPLNVHCRIHVCLCVPAGASMCLLGATGCLWEPLGASWVAMDVSCVPLGILGAPGCLLGDYWLALATAGFFWLLRNPKSLGNTTKLTETIKTLAKTANT